MTQAQRLIYNIIIIIIIDIIFLVSPSATDADLLYDTLRRVNIDFLTVGDKAAKFLTENLKRKVAVLNNVLNNDDSKTSYSSRKDHPEWFSGLETNVTTKVCWIVFKFKLKIYKCHLMTLNSVESVYMAHRLRTSDIFERKISTLIVLNI